jgi:hypothetical protein
MVNNNNMHLFNHDRYLQMMLMWSWNNKNSKTNYNNTCLYIIIWIFKFVS